MSNKTKEVKPPKQLAKAMIEAAEGKKKLPENVKKAAKKIRLNFLKDRENKLNKSKTMKQINNRVIKKAHGGSMCRGMGAATKGGQFRKNG